jgi:hypothetical protein
MDNMEKMYSYIRGWIKNDCRSGICVKENFKIGIKLCRLFIWKLKFKVLCLSFGAVLRRCFHNTERGVNSREILKKIWRRLPLGMADSIFSGLRLFAKLKFHELWQIQKFKTHGQSKPKVANKFWRVKYAKWIQKTLSDHRISYYAQSTTTASVALT